MEFNNMYLKCLKANQTLGFYEYYGDKVIDTINYRINEFCLKVDIVDFKD